MQSQIHERTVNSEYVMRQREWATSQFSNTNEITQVHRKRRIHDVFNFNRLSLRIQVETNAIPYCKMDNDAYNASGAEIQT